MGVESFAFNRKFLARRESIGKGKERDDRRQGFDHRK